MMLSNLRPFFVYLMLLNSVVFAEARVSQAPDWATLMMGRWSGEGARVDIRSGVQTLLEVQVFSQWTVQGSNAALISRNHLKETELDVNGNPVRQREYDRVFWVREKKRQGARVDLIFGSGSTPGVGAESQGVYDDSNKALTVQQDVSPSIRVFSQSDLSNPGLTIYFETIWINGEKKTSAEIRYQRSP